MSSASSQLEYYKSLAKPAGSHLESAAAGGTRIDISGRAEKLEADLLRVVEDHLDNDSGLRGIALQIARESREVYRIIENDDAEYLARHPAALQALEVVVHADGSRPSFLVRHGEPDLSTSPEGDWAEVIAVAQDEIKAAIAATGRINCPSAAYGFEGTGFRVAPNLIATNRHVLQAIAQRNATGEWIFEPGVHIDFGHEYRAIASLSPRAVRRVAFAAEAHVDPESIDHNILDLVLIELEPAAADDDAGLVAIDVTTDWANTPGAQIFTIGYAARPRPGAYPPNLLEQLFRLTYNYKRFAPGRILDSGPGPLSIRHDATTLGGNSGSILVNLDQPKHAAAIHYGGTRREPRANWAHPLSSALTIEDFPLRGTLSEVFDAFQVKRFEPFGH